MTACGGTSIMRQPPECALMGSRAAMMVSPMRHRTIRKKIARSMPNQCQHCLNLFLLESLEFKVFPPLVPLVEYAVISFNLTQLHKRIRHSLIQFLGRS